MAKEYRSFYYDELQKEPVTDDFCLPAGTEMEPDLLRDLINEHRETRLPRYMHLKAAYEGRYRVFRQDRKPDYKPDNRLAAPLAQYLCDTFTGYFIGVPASIRHEDKAQHEWLAAYEQRNEQEDKNAELAEECSKYGHCFEYLFQDEAGLPCSTVLTPICSFLVKDDTVMARPMFGVCYSYDEESAIRGYWVDERNVTYFHEGADGIEFDAPESHAFGGVPMVEYVENKERRGVYEGVLNLIESYNKIVSEKANDVDYFADAYLVVQGTELPDDFKKDLREYRLINPYDRTGNTANLKVYFLEKPDADGTQENLINRLETLIFKTAMIPDISDESFGTASGIALKMRLLPMSNLAMKKERKFKSAMRRRYRLLASYPNKPFDDAEGVEIVMYRNMPEDLASEATLAGSLAGIVSEETQLSVLSCVDDPKEEMARKESERDRMADAMAGAFPTNRTNQEETDYADDEG